MPASESLLALTSTKHRIARLLLGWGSPPIAAELLAASVRISRSAQPIFDNDHSLQQEFFCAHGQAAHPHVG
jgi:hypothetical protein